MLYTDKIIHYTTEERIRVSIALTKNIAETARKRHGLSPVAAAALGRTMTGALLLAGDYKNHEGVSICIKGDGPLGAIYADAFDTNKFVVMLIIQLSISFERKWQAGCRKGGGQGKVMVTRFTPEKTTYTSQSNLVQEKLPKI